MWGSSIQNCLVNCCLLEPIMKGLFIPGDRSGLCSLGGPYGFHDPEGLGTPDARLAARVALVALVALKTHVALVAPVALVALVWPLWSWCSLWPLWPW